MTDNQDSQSLAEANDTYHVLADHSPPEAANDYREELERIIKDARPEERASENETDGEA